MALQVVRESHIHFFGLNGLIGALVGLLIFIVIAVLLFRIITALMPALGLGAPWNSVIYWILVLILFLIFLGFMGIF
jgi:hypothetical protein